MVRRNDRVDCICDLLFDLALRVSACVSTSNIIFISEKQEPKEKSKGKGVPSQIKKQASSKGKEANKRKADKTDDVSGRCSQYLTLVRVFF